VLVEEVGRPEVHHLRPAFDLGHVTLPFATHPHEVEANLHVEDINLHFSLLSYRRWTVRIRVRLWRHWHVNREAVLNQLLQVRKSFVGEQIDEVVL